MKKILYCLFFSCFIGFSLFGQTYIFSSYCKNEYKISLNYEMIRTSDSYKYDLQDKKFKKTGILVEKKTIITPAQYIETDGFNCLSVKTGISVNTTDYKISKSDFLGNIFVYSAILGDLNPRWVPMWYFEALEKKNRDLISKSEPNRLTWDADISPDVWYKDIPQVASIILSNTGMTFYTPLNRRNTGFLFSKLKKINDTIYEATAYPAVQDNNEDISWEPYKENYPLLKDGNPVKFRFEINGKCMKIYNADNNKIVFDLIQMPAEWVELYEDFVRTNTAPEGLELPEEYLERNEKNLKPTAVIKSSLVMNSVLCASDNLRLRSTEDTSSTVITTMQKGTSVKIIKIGG
jgi:hypothetical protein